MTPRRSARLSVELRPAFCVSVLDRNQMPAFAACVTDDYFKVNPLPVRAVTEIEACSSLISHRRSVR